MNHGIVALELLPDITGGAVWGWATASGVIPVVYANTTLKECGGERNEIFSDTFVRVAGQTRPITVWDFDVTEDYGRFQPRNRADFLFMCDLCMRGWLGLVGPPTITDEEAMRSLQRFHEQGALETINWGGIRDEPIAQAVNTMPVGVQWIHLVGLTTKHVFTVLLSEDPAVMSDFEAHSRAYAREFRIRERW